MLAVANDHKLIIQCIAKYVSAFPQIKFPLFRLYPQFRGNAENSAFFVFLVRALRRRTTSGKYMMHF